MKVLFCIVLFVTMGISCLAQVQRKIPFNGQLLDMEGNPIKKAKVYIRSPKQYVVSNAGGNFGLTNVKSTDTLKVSINKNVYIVPVGDRKSVLISIDKELGNISVKESEELYEKGFDHVLRREAGMGNIISGSTLRRRGVNLYDALKGRVSGLVSTGDGQPGDEPRVNMRGIRSFEATSTPLYIVDGLEVETLSDVSVYDVDYVEVLKDGSIYGSRGANGVIIVFTNIP